MMDGFGAYLGGSWREDWSTVIPGNPNVGANQTYPYNGLPGTTPNVWQQVVGQVTTNNPPTPLLKPGPTYNINVIIVAGQDAERIQVTDSLKEAISKAVIEALQVAADEDTLEAFTQD